MLQPFELQMLTFLQLALISHQKGQWQGRNRFLLLGGIAATRAGIPEVAAQCRELVLLQAPKHLIGQHPTIGDALKHPDFQPFLLSLERFCSFEEAEFLPPMETEEDPERAAEKLLLAMSG